jgi:hypothetical protein
MNPELEADYSDFLRFPEVPPPFVAGCAQSGPGMVFPGPVCFRRSRDVGAYLGLVLRRYQSGEIDYTGSISKCGDARLRTPAVAGVH